MRNSTSRFIKAVQDYLKTAISERVAEANREDPGLHLPDIAGWYSGFDGVLSGLQHYPGCIVLVNGKTLLDAYTTQFTVVVGIGLAADDMSYLERMGRIYEDILEDCIRSDWHLGGAALDTELGTQFDMDCVSGVYLIQAQLKCQVDLGGFVYEDGEGDGEVVSLSEMHGDLRAGDGDGGETDLPEVPQPGDQAGDGGAGEEAGPAGIAGKEE